MPPRISWPVALIVVTLLAAVTVLAALGKPVSELIGLGTLVLGALLYGEVKQVQQQTNGTTHRLMSIVDKVTPPGTVDSGQSTQDGTSKPL